MSSRIDNEVVRHFNTRIEEACSTGNETNQKLLTTQLARVNFWGRRNRHVLERLSNDDTYANRLGIDPKAFKPTEVSPILAFSPRTKAVLAEAGLVTDLSKSSMENMITAGFNLSKGTDLYRLYFDPEIMRTQARGTEVAIPSEIILPGRFLPSLKDQRQILIESEVKIRETLGINDIRVIMGEAPDYADLVRLNQKGSELPIVPENMAILTSTWVVCQMESRLNPTYLLNLPDQGIQLEAGNPTFKNRQFGIIPLIVPSSVK